jgi:hypothetical protein
MVKPTDPSEDAPSWSAKADHPRLSRCGDSERRGSSAFAEDDEGESRSMSFGRHDAEAVADARRTAEIAEHGLSGHPLLEQRGSRES